MNESLKQVGMWIGALALAGAAAFYTGQTAQGQSDQNPTVQGLSVRSIQLATELERGRPNPAVQSVPRSAGRMYCVVRVTNTTGAETSIRVGVERASGEPSAAQNRGTRLDIPASRAYRTLARMSSRRAAGSYRCVVRAPNGEVLGHQDFSITE